MIEEAGPEKKAKYGNIRNYYTNKQSLGETLAKEAVRGASFKYLAESELIKKGLSTQQENQPSRQTVSRHVNSFAEELSLIHI